MNREYTREHMIFQLVVHTNIDELFFDALEHEDLKALYEKYVKVGEDDERD